MALSGRRLTIAAACKKPRRTPTNVGAAKASGEVVFGLIGDDNRLEYTVIGDAVNLAAKLEKHTKAEIVRSLTTRDSLEVAGSQGYAAPTLKRILLNREVGGVAAPLDLAVLG